MTFHPKLEAAIGADRSQDPLAWDWTDLTDRTATGGSIGIRAGQDDGGNVQPASVNVTLDNGDQALSTRNPLSPHWPHFGRGTPVRVTMDVGDPFLALTGAASSSASTPDHASLDVTGDHWGALEVLAPLRNPPDQQVYDLVNKWEGAGDERSWTFMLFHGHLILFWSEDGVDEMPNAAPTFGTPCPLAGRLTVGWHLDVDDGDGGHQVSFYAVPGGTIEDLEADPDAYLLGDPWVGVGTTSVFAGTAALAIGRASDIPTSGPYPGAVRRFRFRSGDHTGTILADPDFTAQTPGDGSFTDTAASPKTWTINAPAAIAAGVSTRFLGEIGTVAPTWPGNGVPGTAQAELSIAGVLRRMRQRDKPLRSAIYRMAMAKRNSARVIAGWPLEDGNDAEVGAPALPGGEPLRPSFEFALGTGDTSLAGGADVSAGVASAQPGWWDAPVPDYTAPSNNNWGVSWFLRMETLETSPAFTRLQVIRTTGTVREWHIVTNTAGTTVFGFDVEGNAIITTVLASDDRQLNAWSLLHLQAVQDGANVDWEFSWTPNPSGPGFVTSGTVAGTVGKVRELVNRMTAPPDGISFAHFWVTVDTNLFWLAPADSGWVGELAAQRIFRLCEEEGVPINIDGPYGYSSPSELLQSAQAMGRQRPAALLALIDECVAVDRGVLSEQRELLGLHYRSHETLHNQAPALTVDAGIMNPFEPVDDDQALVNDQTVSRVNGSSAQAIDQDSIDTNGLYEGAETINAHTDAQLPHQAAWRLHVGTWPDYRYPGFTAELGKNTDTLALIDDWVDTAPGDLVRVENLPLDYHASEVDQLLDGYREVISAESWEVNLNGHPAGAWEVGVVEDLVLGRADTAGSVLHEAIDAVDTSFDVAVTDGPMWTTDDAEFPFDVEVGGEEVTVIDIAPSTPFGGAGGAGTAAHANNASVTPGLPPNVAAGNLMVMPAAIRNLGVGVPNTPAGWTRVPVFAPTAGDDTTDNVQLFLKIADASESAPTITFTGGAAGATCSAQIYRFNGRWGNAENLIVGAANMLGLGQDIAYPALAIDEDRCLVLWIGWKSDDWTSVATIAGTTEIGEPSSTLGDDQGIVWAYAVQATAADVAAGSFVVTGGAPGATLGAVVALRCDRQTWTVTRATNGVEKSHPAGAAVSLAHPWRAAL